MADPLLRLVAAQSAPAQRARPLLTPDQARQQAAPAPKPAGAPSLFDQVTGMVTGLPGGLIGMGSEAAQTLAGFPRLASYEAGGLLRGEGIKKPSDDFGQNLHEFFPLLESFRQSGSRTAYRVSHPGDYIKAAQEGQIVPAIAEDAANLSILAAPAAKIAGAAAGATAEASGVAADAAAAQAARAGAQVTAKAGAEAGATAAGDAGARVGAETAADTGAKAGAEGFQQARARFQPKYLTPQRFPMPSELSPDLVARPGVLKVGQAIERLARPAEEVANAPARIWQAPFQLARGVELPKFFGTTEEGAARQFGLKPLLDRTGITQKVMEQPSVAAAAEQFGDWRERRRQAADLRAGALAPAASKVHVAATEIQRELEPARRILGDDPELTYANHLIHTGGQAAAEVVSQLPDRLRALGVEDPEGTAGKVIAETWGMRQAPSEATLGHVLDYHNGTMDPALRDRMDQAWVFEKRALDKLQQVKLERGQLNPAQLLNEPMQHRVDAITGRTEDRIQALLDEIEGTTDASGAYTPGLRAHAAAAEAAVPAVDIPKLAGYRATAAARKAGAVDQEAVLAGRQAETAGRQAETARVAADRARGGTLQGARDEMAQLQKQRYGFSGEYQPEWTQSQLEAGRAERAQAQPTAPAPEPAWSGGPTLPPVLPGHVRLWRGEGPLQEGPGTRSWERGTWWADNPDYPRSYMQPGGGLRWTDVPEQALPPPTPNFSGLPGHYQLPAEVADAARQRGSIPYEQAQAPRIAEQNRPLPGSPITGAEAEVLRNAPSQMGGPFVDNDGQFTDAGRARAADAFRKLDERLAAGEPLPERAALARSGLQKLLGVEEPPRLAPSRVPFTVPDDELALAEKISRLEGQGRTAGVEQQAPRAAAATERAAGAQQAGAEARGRIFTEAAQPVMQEPTALPFGQMSEADRSMFAAPPAANAPVTPEHRAEAVAARDEVARAAEQAKLEHSERLTGVGASLDATGKPTIGYIPDYYREHVPTLMEQQAPGARSNAQREAIARKRQYGARPAELGFVENLKLEEWKMLKRHMRAADRNDIAAPDEWATELANTEGRVRADVSTDDAVGEMMAGLKRWENAEDLAHGVKPRWPEELDNTMQLSPADRAMVEALPGRKPAQVALRRVGDDAAEAMVRARREGLVGEHADIIDRILPESRLGPSPWKMEPQAYSNELGGVLDELAPTIDTPPEQWTPRQVQANQRMLELVPESLGDISGLTDAELYDRIHQAAQAAGRDVLAPRLATEAPGARLAAAGEAGRGEVGMSESLAAEAFKLDQGTREAAAARGEPVDPLTMARGQLNPAEQKMYDEIGAGERDAVAGQRLEAARQKLTTDIRQEGERAGHKLGTAEGKATVLEGQAAAAGQRAETLAPRVEAAGERAQQVAEQEVGRPLRFGENRGKRIRDMQIRQRALRTREGQMRWLTDEVLPRQQRELAQGPREVAPGRYQPALMTNERLYDAIQRMSDDLAAATGDKTMSGEFWDLMGDVPRTMEQLHAKGIYPEYISGAVDEPTRGGGTMAGGEQQLPWSRFAPSSQRKKYGHVPQQIRTLHRSMVNDVRVMVEQDTALLMRDKWAKTGHDVVDELVQAGELEPWKADVLRGPNRDRSVDFAKQMEDAGYTAWDPESPRLPTDRQAGPDSYYLPTPMAQEFQRWWKPANPNGAVRIYDQMTRGFKHGVLAMSPSWQVNNVIGNAFMAVVFGGESPAAIYRATREVLAKMREGGSDVRQMFPVPERPGNLSRAGRAVVNRIGPLRRAREWGRDLAAAPAVGPARLYGAGSHAEISRGFAESNEPKTWFGRGLQTAYRVNETVDNVGRTALYMLKRDKGYSNEAAVGQALGALGDFNNMTRFERDIVRRVIPFYVWMRHVTQASMHLAVDHPWRTAWLLHVSNLFNPQGQDTGVPDYLKSGLGLGGGWYVPFGGANPLQGNAGSIFTSPSKWPGELARSLNPVIKLGASAAGVNLSQGRLNTRPPGTGPLDVYGKQVLGLQAPSEIAYMALRQVPQGRLITDLVYNPSAREFLPPPVLRYDTGQAIKRQRRVIPQSGGRAGGVIQNLSVPFFPTYVDDAQMRARIAKGQAAARKAQQSYNST